MGIFDWFTRPRSNVTELDDAIWMTRQAKYAGIAAAAARLLDATSPPPTVLLVAHFRDCLDELLAVLAPTGLDRRTASFLAAALDSSAWPQGIPIAGSVEILVAERHPLRSHDGAISAFARSLPSPCRIAYHLSLEDPLLQRFGGEWLPNVLRQLGAEEGEAIESRMVGRRIGNAQAQLARQAVSDLKAGSAAEWLQLNCREGC